MQENESREPGSRPSEHVTVGELIESARRLAAQPARTFLGVTGPPGSGKSTVAELLVAAVGANAVLISMDGFHLANEELLRLGRLERKGAPDTFDAGGFVALLRRLHDAAASVDDVVYAPRFDRSLEESIGSAVPVAASASLVLVEGNYLLTTDPPWNEVRDLLNECWYLEPAEEVRLARLVARHQRYGRDLAEATSRSWGSDQRNAERIAASRSLATRVLTLIDEQG